MNKVQSKQYLIEALADFAFWGGGPTTGPSRSSTLFPSHGAADGFMRRILGHRAIQWVIHEILLLSEPRRIQVTTNDLKTFVNKDTFRLANIEIVRPLVHDEKNHTQRTTVYLVGPAHYAMRASMVLSPNAEADDHIRKFEEMFERRARQGQSYETPYMGVSECPAIYNFIEDESSLEPPVDYTEDFGLQYFDRDWTQPGGPFYFAYHHCEHGVMKYPNWDKVRALGIRRDMERSA